jgi:hypothetical protein
VSAIGHLNSKFVKHWRNPLENMEGRDLAADFTVAALDMQSRNVVCEQLKIISSLQQLIAEKIARKELRGASSWTDLLYKQVQVLANLSRDEYVIDEIE